MSTGSEPALVAHGMPVPSPNLLHVRFAGVPLPEAAPLVDRKTVASHRSAGPPVPLDRAEAEGTSGFARRSLERAGLNPDSYRAAPLARRVPACLRALKVDSEQAADERVAASPEMLECALGVLLIGVTAFFRDDAVFAAIEQMVIPELARPGTIRIWSAGCSSGAELYSVAMLLAEAGLLDRAELTGTDCRASAIEGACQAWYDDAAVAALPPGLRRKYMTPHRGGWQVADRLRNRVRWNVADLLSRVEPGPWDLVLCRNVTIYLEPTASDRLLRAIAGQLAPGAFVVSGKAERLPASIPTQTAARCVYRVWR